MYSLEPGHPIENGKLLQSRFREFAALNTKDREGAFGSLIADIGRLASAGSIWEVIDFVNQQPFNQMEEAGTGKVVPIESTDTVASNADYKLELFLSVKAALQRPFLLDGTKIVNPWHGNYTAILIGSDGSILAAQRDESLPKYLRTRKIRDLFPDVLVHGAVELHLSKHEDQLKARTRGYKGYLGRLSPGNCDTRRRRGAAISRNGRVFAASGADLTDEYMALLGGAGNGFLLKGISARSRIDRVFAQFIADGPSETAPFPEPDLLTRIRHSAKNRAK